MTDLSVEVVQRFGLLPIMPPNPTLLVNLDQGELIRMAETVSRSITLQASVSELIRIYADYVTGIRGNTGQVAFNASPDHSSVTSYTARVRVSGSATSSATQALGKPTPDGNNVIVVDLSATFAGLAAGNYTVSILTTSAGGSTDSTESTPFALPLS